MKKKITTNTLSLHKSKEKEIGFNNTRKLT